jgi:hypothetical protein
MSLVLTGSTSGSCTLQEQAVAGTTTLTLPTFSGTVGLLVSGTAVASTSGTSIDFTSIPAGVRRITVMFYGVSTNGTSRTIIQLGTSSGVTTSGYLGSNGTANFSSGVFTDDITSASAIRYLQTVITNITGTTWVATSNMGRSDATTVFTAGGGVALSGVLDRIRITTVSGTDTFDAGSINIFYE